ncbi:hypothetical protein O3M35_006290 [Rhynocoris fuscipes]|uniref:Lipid droplet-associated hydrolase n=1 Tax=Rhynocoris fuscipes TaxID=488301 RepID=A0AAW1DFH5_9HEMI
MYKSGWIMCNGVPTCVRTWGGWITDNLKSDSVVLLITGNPGITDFYKKFLSSLNKSLNIPVWVLCHAGNQIPPSSENMIMPSLNSNPDLYNLDGQVKHKEDFILNYIPESKKIYLIGHSIGGKISVELMKNERIAKRVGHVYLMCPTLQYIGDTPNGKFYRMFLGRISPFLIMLAWIFTFLPYRIRAGLVYTFTMLYSLSFTIESCCVSGLLKLFTPKVLKGVFFFAQDEMDNVKALDHEIYENYYDKIQVYFGVSDRWAPLYQYEDLKKKYPLIECKLLEPYFTHSFVFRSSEAAAEKLTEQIKRIK